MLVVHAYSNVLLDASASRRSIGNAASNDMWEVYHTLGRGGCASSEQMKAVVAF